jgi:hypothetical protein
MLIIAYSEEMEQDGRNAPRGMLQRRKAYFKLKKTLVPPIRTWYNTSNNNVDW